MPLSYSWLFTRWHIGIHLHNFLAFAYFVDIVRRHSHPHNWVLNLPVFGWWLLDNIASVFFRTATPDVHRVTLSDDYMLLLWDQRSERSKLRTRMMQAVKRSSTAAHTFLSDVIGPKFFFRMRQSSCLERAHVRRLCLNHCGPQRVRGTEPHPARTHPSPRCQVFTGMENRMGLDLWPGHEWTAMLVVRIYRNPRAPPWPFSADKISHTHRVHTADAEEATIPRTLRTYAPTAPVCLSHAPIRRPPHPF